ncbi:hypothetical protein WJX73_008477 [Symbiochloris irregularis]|uniref:quinolinate synthase n=1 Tax=Symbiochloris irregularis TaxID=706552 RepID=A0AAW1P2R5_9CHLO
MALSARCTFSSTWKPATSPGRLQRSLPIKTRARRLHIAAAAVSQAVTQELTAPAAALRSIATQLGATHNAKEQLQLLMKCAEKLRGLPGQARTWSNRVMGCTAQVWVTAELDAAGRVVFAADSDSRLTQGLAFLLEDSLSGLTPDEVAEVNVTALSELGIDPHLLTPSRSNSFLTLLQAMRKRATLLGSGAQLASFPSLIISARETVPVGAFAEAQARYLNPDQTTVDALVRALTSKRIGVVAHFYMDPQVQGVLTSAAAHWPHIRISDSLVMADAAVRMAEAGCTSVAVLGVDFMSENVRAILDEAGHTNVQVYRMAADDIGCSLAEAAESEAYAQYLAEAAKDPHPGLHVVYINTSLRTKALSHAVVPTITCTSSNVVQTVLQGFAQIPDLHVWYGPDSYMGANLAQLFTALAQSSDDDVAALHPSHTVESVRKLLPRLHHFAEGICVVHHMFGSEVTNLVRRAYPDAHLAAHFEVPGEMFSLAMEAKRQRDAGVVGSTQNILDFIGAKLSDALQHRFPERVQVILGTDAEGGCASCPFMKMNTLKALMRVCELVSTPGEALLVAQQPRTYTQQVGARSMASVGCEPILHMRGFQKTGKLPPALEADVIARGNSRS